VLLLVYGIGATLGNFVGGWLSDRALLPSTIGLLAALSGTLALFWFLSPLLMPSGAMVFITGALAFAIIPGMQTRVLVTASAAPTLGIALNASGFQIAAAVAAWLGGRAIDSGLGLRFVYLLGAALTVGGIIVSCCSWLEDRRTARLENHATDTSRNVSDIAK
jgi:DHA1 family inner membrane transport protein